MPTLKIGDNAYEIIAAEIRLDRTVLKRELFPPISITGTVTAHFNDRALYDAYIQMQPSVYRTYKSLMAGLAAYDAARAAGRNWRRCKRERRRAMLQARRRP